MAIHIIEDEVDFAGDWYVPGPEGQAVKRVAGVMKWRERHVELSLHGSFDPMPSAVFGSGDLRSFPVIHGVTTVSEAVTLLRALANGTQMSFGMLGLQQNSRLHSNICVIGAHVDNETKYSAIQARVPGLEHWLDMPIVSTVLRSPSPGEPQQVIYTVTKVPSYEAPLDEQQMTLKFGVSFNGAIGPTTNVSVTGYGFIDIVPIQPQPMDWMLEMLARTTTLVSILSGSPMSPCSIQAKLSDAQHTVSWLVHTGNYETSKVTSGGDFFMTRSGMEIPLGDALVRWFDDYETIETPCQLGLSVLNSRGLWLHVEFLTYMQALEGLHRGGSKGLYTSEEEYKAIEQAITQAIPSSIKPEHKASLKARIKFGNEISLRNRVKELVDPVDVEIRKRIFGADGKFPSRWVDARNYYTHWDEKSKGKDLDPQAMYNANQRMRTLLRVLYILGVGIPSRAVLKSLENGSVESQTLANIAAAEHRHANPGSQAGALLTITQVQAPKADADQPLPDVVPAAPDDEQPVQ